MSKASLHATVPNAKNLRAAYIKNFRREFSKMDDEGMVDTNADIAGVPYCAVDVISGYDGEFVNGIIFETDETYLAALKRREYGYELLPVDAYDFRTGRPLGTCFVFSSNIRNGVYDYDNLAQTRYLELCLNGAKEYGKTFYKQFLASTYVNHEQLDMLPRLTGKVRWQSAKKHKSLTRQTYRPSFLT